MRILSLMLTVTVLALSGAGCSDDPKKIYNDGGVALDSYSPSEGGSPDQMVPDQTVTPDLPPASSSAAQTVINKLKLPASGAEYATDIDGNGTKDNQLGHIMGALKLMGGAAFDPQKDLDSQVKQGKILLLFDVKAKSIKDDAAMQLQFYLGSDLDSDATDNFNGTEEFGIDSTSPTNLILPGSIASSKMAVKGSLLVPIPIGTTPTTVTLKKASVTSTLSSTGMTSGVISGAIPFADVNKKLLPALAEQLDAAWKSATDPTLKGLLGGMDTDKDGTIEGSDLTGNLLIGIFIKADVDTDGDKTMDAMSVGMGFTAVNCKIKGTK